MEIKRTLADLYLAGDTSRISYLDIISGKAEVAIQLTEEEIQKAYDLRHEELRCQSCALWREKPDIIDRHKIGHRVKERRRELDMTQDMLAQLTGIHRTTIVYIEDGRNAFSLGTLERLAKTLDTSVGYLLGYSEINIVHESQK